MESKHPSQGAGQNELTDTVLDVTNVSGKSVCETQEVNLDYCEEAANATFSTNTKFVDNFTNGILQNMLPNLEKAQGSLEEALRNQDILIETVQQENAKFTECSSMKNLVEMMNSAKVYYNKLLSVKKDMIMLTERTAKIKRRAVKLQHQKQKEEQYLIQQREREMEREQKLMARVAKPETKS